MENIGDQLEFDYRNFPVHLHIHNKMHGFKSNSLDVARKTAKSKTVDLENSAQNIYYFAEIRWSNVPCHLRTYGAILTKLQSWIPEVCPW